MNKIRLWAFHTVQNILENEEDKAWGHDHSERRASLLHGFQVSIYNFTNIIHIAFMRADHKSAENTVKLSVFFALLGSAQVKAAHKMLVKLTTGVSKIQLTKKARQFH